MYCVVCGSACFVANTKPHGKFLGIIEEAVEAVETDHGQIYCRFTYNVGDVDIVYIPNKSYNTPVIRIEK